MTPVDRAGYSILIYDVRYPLDASIDRAVIGGPIASDVPPNDLGMQPDHPLRAKWCAYLECFIFTPHPARYIVRDFIPFELELAKQARAQARPISANSRYSVFDLDATSLIQDKVAALHDAPATTPGGIAVTLPINFDNGLSLVGYEVTNLAKVSKPSQGLDVLTYWRVDGPITPPLKIFVHLLDPQGNIRGQDDNFGAAVRMLESGDLVIQHHPIKIAADAPAGTYRLEVGLYNPDTLDRFQAHPSALPSVDRIFLSTFEIER